MIIYAGCVISSCILIFFDIFLQAKKGFENAFDVVFMGGMSNWRGNFMLVILISVKKLNPVRGFLSQAKEVPTTRAKKAR